MTALALVDQRLVNVRPTPKESGQGPQLPIGADIALKGFHGVLPKRNDSSNTSTCIGHVGPHEGGELVHDADDSAAGGLGQPPLAHLFGFGPRKAGLEPSANKSVGSAGTKPSRGHRGCPGTKRGNSVASFTNRAGWGPEQDGRVPIPQRGGRGLFLMRGCPPRAVAELLRGMDNQHGYGPACLAVLARASRWVRRICQRGCSAGRPPRAQATAARPA